MQDHEHADIGKYKIVGQIGEGAMGIVYRALDPVLNRTVAIKVMSDSIARDNDLRGRFLREAQAAGSLQHPNVVTIFDCGEVDGHLFIAMEFVEGEDLEQLMGKENALSLTAKLDIMIDVLGGLAFAHKRGIVHRDIKPANIRIDSEGRARIMDFGIAHLASSNLTKTGIMVGTPAYMAPEQIVGGVVSAQTDIFSVGSVLYELLSGARPFYAETLHTIMYKIVSEAPPPLNSKIPPDIGSVVTRALAKDPAERYASALEMADALAQVRGGIDRTAVAARTVSLRARMDSASAEHAAAKDAPKKNRGLLIGAVAAATVAAVALFIAFSKRGGGAPVTPVDAGAAKSASVAAPAPAPVITPPSSAAVQPAPAQTVGRADGKPAADIPAKGAKTSTKDGAKGPTAEELALFRTLRMTALDGRRRAAEAGANSEQLQPGDDHSKVADALAQQGRIPEAANHITQATDAWNTAERDARAAAAVRTRVAANDQQRQPNPTPPTTQIPVQQPVSPPAPVTSAPAPQAAATPPANPSADIRAAVAAYAQAIESRDIAEVRRAYPGITPQQATGFEQFFARLKSLHANFSVGNIDVNGNAAEARLTGKYEYVTTAGKAEETSVSFQASFRRDGGAWRLFSVR